MVTYKRQWQAKLFCNDERMVIMLTGSLQVQGDKYYMVINYYEDGKRRPKWISTGLSVKGNKRAAQQMLNEHLADAEKNDAFNSRKQKAASDLKFLAYIKNWLESRQGSIEEGTYASYEGMINGRLTEFFKKENPLLTDFSPQHLESFYIFLRKKNLSGNTLLHYHACVRKALSHALKTGLVPENIADKVDRPKKDKYIAGFYDREELNKLFDLSRGDPLELLIYVTAFYGLRKSEALGLKWEVVDFKNKTVTIKHKVTSAMVDGKTTIIAKDKLKTKSSNRTLPLLPQVEERLLAERARQKHNKKLCRKSYEDSGYIFVNDLGELIRPNYVTQHFSILLTNKGLRKIRFHDLRHSCASLLLSLGIPMKQIQDWLGHSNFSTTADLYAHLDYSSKQDSGNAIAGALSA